jgi:TolB-like protein
MTRAPSSSYRAWLQWALRMAAIVAAIVASIVASGSVAHAGKQKVAVLTLEVIGNMDSDHLRLAKVLSTDLRDKIKNSTEYGLVGGEKDFVDEKLMNSCQTEALGCMAPIGAKLDADLLMYGKMERTAKGFQITIKLIRVASRAHVNTWSEDVAFKRVVDESKSIAKLAFGRLMPNQSGTLIVKVPNVDRATVYIDGEAKGTVSSGLYTTSLPEGRYKLAIEAAEKGWNRYEDTITIRAGEPKNVAADLTRIKATPLEEPGRPAGPGGSGGPGGNERKPDELKHETTGTVSQSSKKTGWKVLAAGGLITSAVAGGVWLWSYSKITDYRDLLDTHNGARDEAVPAYELDRHDCGGSRVASGTGKQAFKDACSARTRIWVAAPITIAAGLAGAVGVFMLLRNEKAAEDRPSGTAGRRTKKRSFAVTPVVSPDGAGATVRFDW